MTKKILPQYKKLLSRKVNAIVHFNDVFSDQSVDFDAELTAIIRNLGNLSDKTYPIGNNLYQAEYGLNLLSDLSTEQKRIIQLVKKQKGKQVSKQFTEGTIISIANCAPRSKEATANGKNGNDFHLAITDDLLEIYCVPISTLKTLETRNKILALYKIPNEKIPTTDGQKEQFRSSIITTTRYFPNILEPIFQYKNREELLKAKKLGKHPNIIETQTKDIEFAYADKFGNVRISVKDSLDLNKKINDCKKVQIQIGKSEPLVLYYTKSLKEIPENEIGLYENIADKKDNESKAGYWEIVKKTNNPNTEESNAYALLKALSKDLRNDEITIKPTS